MYNALLPVSVSGSLFSSTQYLDCLNSIPTELLDSCTFLIADQLQIYNRSRTKSISEVLSNSTLKKHKLERERWIGRIIEKLQHFSKWNQRPIQFNVISIEQILDANFFQIYRGLRVLFSTSTKFRGDILMAARKHVLSSSRCQAPYKKISLSADYIIEEIAINIKLRLGSDLQLEFYPGDYHAPLIKLYLGLYEVTHFELFGQEKLSGNFRFFSYMNSSREWQEVATN